MKTLLAIGAHYDDCVFGIPGIMLQAVRKHYRVVILSLIGDYSNWARIGNRQSDLLEGTKAICRDYGVEMRYLDFASHLFDMDTPAKIQVAEVVAELQPDVAFMLWRADQHDDHVVASRLSHVALRSAATVLNRRDVKTPGAIYEYDNGPRHTIGFEPNTFVDVTDDWPQALDWLGRFMALVRGQAYDPATRDAAQQTKEAIALYRGKTCGVAYAEAVYTAAHRPVEIL
jgi:LmbE family N-acetylglucosaminyl deacetylase